MNRELIVNSMDGKFLSVLFFYKEILGQFVIFDFTIYIIKKNNFTVAV